MSALGQGKVLVYVEPEFGGDAGSNDVPASAKTYDQIQCLCVLCACLCLCVLCVCMCVYVCVCVCGCECVCV